MQPEPIPSGLCQCGCGHKTKLASRNHRRLGWIKGQPIRYIVGHGSGKPLEGRFWSKVDKGAGPDGCWPWTASASPHGYGRITIHRRVELAPRVAWALVHGPIPKGLCVLHTCDNPPCCNPAHLFLGTHAVNMADMAAKGRAGQLGRRGEACPHSKLTEDHVRAIRAAVEAGRSQKEVGVEFGIDDSYVSRLVSRERWGWLV